MSKLVFTINPKSTVYEQVKGVAIPGSTWGCMIATFARIAARDLATTDPDWSDSRVSVILNNYHLRFAYGEFMCGRVMTTSEKRIAKLFDDPSGPIDIKRSVTITMDPYGDGVIRTPRRRGSKGGPKPSGSGCRSNSAGNSRRAMILRRVQEGLSPPEA